MLSISKKSMSELVWDVLFFAMSTVVFVFNFNTDRIFGLSGNLWANILIILFVAWTMLNLLKNGGLLHWNKIYTFALLFVSISFISTLYSYAPDDSLSKVKTLVTVFLLSISVYQYIVLNSKLDYVLKVYVSSGTIMSFYILYKAGFSLGGQLGSVIGDENLVGITLALTSTVALYLYLRQHSIVNLFQFVFISVVILFTGSRTATALLFVSILAVIYLSAYIYHWKLRYIVLITVLISIGLFAVWNALMNIPELYDVLGKRIISFYQVTQGQKSVYNESSTQTRMRLARRAFDWFLESPFLGKGINSFLSYNSTFTDGWYGFSHCNYTELLSGVGLIGFSLYYGMFAYGTRIVCKTNNKIAITYKILFVALVVEYLIADIGLVVYYEKTTWILIAILAGILREIVKK